jgi:hypothetical protein
MLDRALLQREAIRSVPEKPAPGGRWAVATYVTAWRRLCDAVWREELEDPLFRRAVELVEANQPGPGSDAHWLEHEVWRDCIRSWWFAGRDLYAGPADIPADWLVEEREWEPERELAPNLEKTRALCSARRAATWTRAEILIETGEFWPLHLDAPHMVRAQFETLRQWAPLAK